MEEWKADALDVLAVQEESLVEGQPDVDLVTSVEPTPPKRGPGRPPKKESAAPPAQRPQDWPPGVVDQIRVEHPREAAAKGTLPYMEDPYFKRLLSRVRTEADLTLEKGLVEVGCREHVTAWRRPDGTLILIDGYRRVLFCIKHDIPFVVDVIGFLSQDDAVRWVLEHQEERRNQSPIEIAVMWLMNKEVLKAQAKDRQRHKAIIPELGEVGDLEDAGTVEQLIAKKSGLSHGTIGNMDTILQRGSVQIQQLMLDETYAPSLLYQLVREHSPEGSAHAQRLTPEEQDGVWARLKANFPGDNRNLRITTARLQTAVTIAIRKKAGLIPEAPPPSSLQEGKEADLGLSGIHVDKPKDGKPPAQKTLSRDQIERQEHNGSQVMEEGKALPDAADGTVCEGGDGKVRSEDEVGQEAGHNWEFQSRMGDFLEFAEATHTRLAHLMKYAEHELIRAACESDPNFPVHVKAVKEQVEALDTLIVQLN